MANEKHEHEHRGGQHAEQHGGQHAEQHGGQTGGKGETYHGVNVVNPTGDFNLEYRKSDVERIYHDAKPQSWQDLIRYIEQKGDAQWHITPGEAAAMKSDFQRLASSNRPFVSNPDKAYEELQKFRSQGQDQGQHRKSA
jgi:hypothetical protein